MGLCLKCGKEPNRRLYIYCSNQCQKDYEYDQYIFKWKIGLLDNSVTRNISQYIRRYLIQTSEEKCSLCGWNKKNIVTGKVPLEVDHIDGDSSNNVESNLRIICPNCHSLSSNFRNLNRGSGRSWRRGRYNKLS
jgi:hypothetical protein